MRTAHRLIALSAAAIAVTGVIALPAQAATRPSGVQFLKGERILTLNGYVGDQDATWQMRLRVNRTNGQVGMGTQEWRTCVGREATCAAGSGDGDGWSAPAEVRFVRTPQGTIVGSGPLGQMFLTASKGQIGGSFVGQSLTESDAKAGQLRGGGSAGGALAGAIANCGTNCAPPK